MFEGLLIEQNPHWNNQAYPPGVSRDCFTKLLEYLPLPHVISVTGIRRCGKTTLLRQLTSHLIQNQIPPKNILFVNLEHPYFSQYRHDVAYLEHMLEDYR